MLQEKWAYIKDHVPVEPNTLNIKNKNKNKLEENNEKIVHHNSVFIFQFPQILKRRESKSTSMLLRSL